MFLVNGNIYHEESWRLWFESAIGAFPIENAVDKGCLQNNSTQTGAASAWCSTVSRRQKYENPIDCQLLFSVYIHVSAEFDGAKVPSSPSAS